MGEKKERRALPLWAIIAGAFMILIGVIRILEIPMEKVWPYLLIVFGVVILAYAVIVWTTGKEVIAEKYEE